MGIFVGDLFRNGDTIVSSAMTPYRPELVGIGITYDEQNAGREEYCSVATLGGRHHLVVHRYFA